MKESIPVQSVLNMLVAIQKKAITDRNHPSVAGDATGAEQRHCDGRRNACSMILITMMQNGFITEDEMSSHLLGDGKYYKLNPPVMSGSTPITMLGVSTYDNGRIAVQTFSIMDVEDGGDGEATEPHDTLSVNLPDQAIMPGVFFARNYSYHTKTHDAMVKAGIIEVVEGFRGSVGMHGYCNAAKLTAKATANPA